MRHLTNGRRVEIYSAQGTKPQVNEIQCVKKVQQFSSTALVVCGGPFFGSASRPVEQTRRATWGPLARCQGRLARGVRPRGQRLVRICQKQLGVVAAHLAGQASNL